VIPENGRSVRRSSPLYSWVADDIESKIDRGAYTAGERLPSEHALCELYDVSQITVRRALRDLSGLGRVYSRHGLGWFVSSAHDPAPAAAQGLLLLDQLDWLSAPLVQHLVTSLAARRIRIELAFSGGSEAREEQIISAALASTADVMLIVPIGERSRQPDRYATLLDQAQVPVMFVLRGVAQLGLPTVALDIQRGMHDITQHLLSLGHTALAYCGDNPVMSQAWEQYWGFAPTLWERGLELPLDWVFAGHLSSQPEAGHFRRVFSGSNPPTGLICASSERAALAIAMLQDLGIDCPHDVAVVGLGDHPCCQLVRPTVTCYGFEQTALQEAAASAVVDLVRGNRASGANVGGHLMIRASCGGNANDARHPLG